MLLLSFTFFTSHKIEYLFVFRLGRNLISKEKSVLEKLNDSPNCIPQWERVRRAFFRAMSPPRDTAMLHALFNDSKKASAHTFYSMIKVGYRNVAEPNIKILTEDVAKKKS